MSLNGRQAPDFKLYNTLKREVTLSELKGGSVLLLFFPLAFTSTCTTELCGVRDQLAIYTGLGATVLGISTDSLFTLGKFRDELGLNFDLLSDYNKTVSAAYGCLYPEWNYGMKGVTKRAAFVVDGSGTIRYSEVLEKAGELPDFNQIKTLLQTIG